MSKIVYSILRNADFTEGRGPMLPMGIAFEDEIEAYRYIGTCDDPYGVNKNIHDLVVKGKALVKQGWYNIKVIHVYNHALEASEGEQRKKYEELVKTIGPANVELIKKFLK